MTDREQKVIDTLGSKKFDIGLMGMWYGANYGSVMTYYALHTILSKLGYSVLMIDKQAVETKGFEFELDDTSHARVFAKSHYENFASTLAVEEMKLLNRYCDTFLLGCDQVWNFYIAKSYGLNYYFDFAEPSKKRVSYASSFGHDVSFTPLEKVAGVTRELNKFDAISVREKSGVEVLKREFGIEGTQVLDPVFLLDRQEYEYLMKESTLDISEKYMLAYILNPSDEIRESLLEISKKKNLKLINILDGNPNKFPKFKEALNLPNTVENITTQDWLYYISHAECVVTDSCHGASFAAIFGTPFVMLSNRNRGTARFDSLAELLDIEDRLFYEPKDMSSRLELLDSFDEDKFRKIIGMERERSMEWLRTALRARKSTDKTVQCVLKKECCGCGACYNACPVDAIVMKLDSEGAYYPEIDFEKCIQCGKCSRVCPGLHPESDNLEEPKCFAGFASDEIREISSSGGIFTVLAEEVLKDGGVVCGAAFDEEFNLAHVVVEKKEDLQALRSSKYVQSTTKKTYTEVKAALDAGRKALYAGCGCQIAGLKNFLGKDYDNLITIDLLCHGGPAPGSFKKYLEDVHGRKKVKYVGFRDKDIFEWEINSTGMTVKYEDGTEYRKIKADDTFYRAFTRAFTMRPHCQVCNFATLPRQGDITLGDFWGIFKYNKDYNDGKGTSIIVANNDKALQALEQIKPKMKLFEPVPLDFVLKRGQPFDKPFRSEPLRDRFMRMLKDVSYRKCLTCCEEDRFDYAYYAMKTGSVADVLDAYAYYKFMSRNNYSVLMVWDSESQEISPFKYRIAEFARKYFPEYMEVRSSKNGQDVQGRCNNIAFSDEDYFQWGKEHIDNGRKKVDLSKVFEKSCSPLMLLPVECFDEITDDSKSIGTYSICCVKGANEEVVLNKLEDRGIAVNLFDDCSIEEWLGYIKYAQWIVTNQREVVDMAVKFNVPVTMIGDNEAIVSYAKKIGLENCVAHANSKLLDPDISGERLLVPCAIDYSKVYKTIERQRPACVKRLKKEMLYREKWTLHRIKAGISRRIPEKYKKKIRNSAIIKKIRR